MSLLPSSARTRRRLGALGVVAAVAGAVWVFSMLEPAPKRVTAEPLDPGAPQVLNDHQVPLPRTDRARINAVLDAFVPAAVERKNPLAAYRLATPRAAQVRHAHAVARAATSRSIPYPASEQRDWTLNFSFPRHVSLDLFVQPRQGADVGPIAFTVEVRRFGKRRWLVDSFFPTAMFPKPRGRAAASRSRSRTSRLPTSRARARRVRRASARPSS